MGRGVRDFVAVYGNTGARGGMWLVTYEGVDKLFSVAEAVGNKSSDYSREVDLALARE